jgi:hypothetical protein
MTNKTQEQLTSKIRESTLTLRRKVDIRERVLRNIDETKRDVDPRERYVCTRVAKLGDFGNYCPGYLEAHKVQLMAETTKEKYRAVLREGLAWARANLDIHKEIGNRELIEEFSGYIQDFSEGLNELGEQE